MRWVPRHMDVHGNEMADEDAKKAARGESRAAASLPARLRKSLPCSVAATKRAHLERLRKEAASKSKGSRRGQKLDGIDPSLPGRSFLKRAAGLTRTQLRALVSLRTSHTPLPYTSTAFTAPQYPTVHRAARSTSPSTMSCSPAHDSQSHDTDTLFIRATMPRALLLAAPPLPSYAFDNLSALINAPERRRGTFGEIVVKEAT